MSEEKGRRILLICMVVIFISIFVDYLLLPKASFVIGGCLFGLFFLLTYRGHNWSRICLFIMLLLYGAGGAYGGIMLFLEYHPVGIILIITMSLLNLSVGFILLLNKSVQAFVMGGPTKRRLHVNDNNLTDELLLCREKVLSTLSLRSRKWAIRLLVTGIVGFAILILLAVYSDNVAAVFGVFPVFPSVVVLVGGVYLVKWLCYCIAPERSAILSQQTTRSQYDLLATSVRTEGGKLYVGGQLNAGAQPLPGTKFCVVRTCEIGKIDDSTSLEDILREDRQSAFLLSSGTDSYAKRVMFTTVGLPTGSIVKGDRILSFTTLFQKAKGSNKTLEPIPERPHDVLLGSAQGPRALKGGRLFSIGSEKAPKVHYSEMEAMSLGTADEISLPHLEHCHRGESPEEVTAKPKAVVQAVVVLPKASREEIEKFIGASKDGDTDIIHALFEKRSADSLVKARDRNMFTALHLASHKGHKGIVDLLLDGAANLNAISKSGFAPLHYAVDQGHDEVAETLVARGADVNLKEQGYGSTPLHYAAVRGNRKIAELLLTRGANPNARDNTHLTPAELAAKEGQKDIAEFLLRKTKTDQPSPDLAPHAERWPEKGGGYNELEEIKRKWKAKALQWWDSCGRESCYCDDNGCLVDGENGMYSKRLRHGGGYIPLNSTRIYCEECADQRLRRM